MQLRLGLNPYGLTYYLGLEARGTPRANPRPAGLEGFLALATELGATTLEPGALEVRHVRLKTPGWWTFYPPRDAAALARCLCGNGAQRAAARRRLAHALGNAARTTASQPTSLT